MPQAIPILEKAQPLGHRFLFLSLFTYFSFFIHIVSTLVLSIFVINSVRPEVKFDFVLSLNLGNLPVCDN